MFADQLAAAIDGARTISDLDLLAGHLWKGHGAGAIADNVAQQLAERLQARKQAARAVYEPAQAQGRPAIYPPRRPRRPVRSPERLARRRRLVLSGPLPPALGGRFTYGQLAVLRIIGDEARDHGRCDRYIDEIAHRASVGRSTVQSALREAQRLGLIHVQERRRRGYKSLSNVVTIVSKEWCQWLARGPRGSRAEPTGFNFANTKRIQETRKGQARKEIASSGPNSMPTEGRHEASRHTRL